MNERSDQEEPSSPLPSGWLPGQLPAEGDPVWDTAARRIMAVAEPELRMLDCRRAEPAAAQWLVIGRCLKPAAVAAAAAAVLLLVTGRSAALPATVSPLVSLALVASDGEPAALWSAEGALADPVLAWIAVQSRYDGQSAPGSDAERGRR